MTDGETRLRRAQGGPRDAFSLLANVPKIPRHLPEFQAAHLARRFCLSATAARIVGLRAFSNGRAAWADANCYVEIWLEKDALSGVVYPVTSLYDAPLMVARGYASLSFLHGAADYIKELEVPTYLYHLGDFDPSGVNAGQKIESTLREMAPDAEIHFERIAVTRDQIKQWDLPTRPTKASDSRSKGFGDFSVELDAIPPDRLRELVTIAIDRHLPARQLQILKIAEAEERRLIGGLVGLIEARL